MRGASGPWVFAGTTLNIAATLLNSVGNLLNRANTRLITPATWLIVPGDVSDHTQSVADDASDQGDRTPIAPIVARNLLRPVGVPGTCALNRRSVIAV